MITQLWTDIPDEVTSAWQCTVERAAQPVSDDPCEFCQLHGVAVQVLFYGTDSDGNQVYGESCTGCLYFALIALMVAQSQPVRLEVAE